MPDGRAADTMTCVVIREPRDSELPLLQAMEVEAGRMFLDVGMPEIAGDDPYSIEWLTDHRVNGVLAVATDADDVPVAYVGARPVDGDLHVDQVTTHPRAMRRGVGATLLDHVADVARGDGLPALTLTTFADVPWNAPYYARLGFAVLPEAEWTPGLREIRGIEAGLGLDRRPRVVMRRPV